MNTVPIQVLQPWLPAFPRAGFQGYFNATTSIQPLLTIDEFRQAPLAHLALEFYPLLKAMVWGGIVWVAFCYVKLLMHYLLAAYEDRWVRQYCSPKEKQM
jgi:hypothetical protein